MNDLVCEEYSKDNCLLCGTAYKHRIYYKGVENMRQLKEAELITHCAYCRTLLRKHKEARRKFYILDNEINYLRYTNMAIEHLQQKNIFNEEDL